MSLNFGDIPKVAQNKSGTLNFGDIPEINPTQEPEVIKPKSKGQELQSELLNRPGNNEPADLSTLEGIAKSFQQDFTLPATDSGVPSLTSLLQQQGKLPKAEPVVPELNIAPPEENGLFSKVKRFIQKPFQMSEEDQIAKSQNVYALSKVMPNVPLDLIEENYADIVHSPEIVKATGIQPGPRLKDIGEQGMKGAIGVGVLAHPVATALALAGFTAINEADNFITSKFKDKEYRFGSGEKALDLLLPEQASEATKDTLDIIDFLGKGAILGRVYKVAPKYAERLTKMTIEKYNMPQKVFINPEKVRSAAIGSQEVGYPGEQPSKIELDLIKSLGMNKTEWKEAVQSGVSIEVPAEKLITLTDKPYWAKIKEFLNIKPFEQTKSTFAGKSKEVVAELGAPTLESTKPQGKGEILRPPMSTMKTPLGPQQEPGITPEIVAPPKEIGQIPVIPAPKGESTLEPRKAVEIKELEGPIKIKNINNINFADVEAKTGLEKSRKILESSPTLEANDLYKTKEVDFNKAKEIGQKYYYDNLYGSSVPSPAFNGGKVIFDDFGWQHITSETRTGGQKISQENIIRRIKLIPKAILVLGNAKVVESEKISKIDGKTYGLLGKFKDGEAIRVIVQQIEKGGKRFFSVFDIEDLGKKETQLTSSELRKDLKSSGVDEEPSSQAEIIKSGTTALEQAPFRPSGPGEPGSIVSEETPLSASGFSDLPTDKITIPPNLGSVKEKIRPLYEEGKKHKTSTEFINFVDKKISKYNALDKEKRQQEPIAELALELKAEAKDRAGFVSKLIEVWKKSQELLANERGGISVEDIKKPIPEPPKIDPTVQKVIDVLKEAKPLRQTQEKLYSQERAKRFARARGVGENTQGEKGFYSEKAQLAGELPRVEFEAIRDKFKQEDIDHLFNLVMENKWLKYTDTLTARTGLVKMFNGSVPTKGEMEKLNMVFPPEFIRALQDKMPMLAKIKEAGLQLLNMPRSIMASFDLSFGGRQGLFLAPSYPKKFFDSWRRQFYIFGSSEAYEATMQSISKNPYFDLAKESNLSMTNMGELMNQREERFMSNWAERIPGVGVGIRASNRAYTGFANKFRMDTFASLARNYEEVSGEKLIDHADIAKNIAGFVNNGTGRGSLGGLETAATALNGFFFSPRLMASRLSLLNPIYYVKQDPFTRKQALKSLFIFASSIFTVLSLCKMSGLEVGTDPRSSDFGKIKTGNTRIDIMGGFQQYLRMAGQLISGQYVSSTTGKIMTLGEGYKPLTRYDIMIRQLESKENPVMSFATDLLKGQTFTGEKVNIPQEIGSRFVPMVAQDAYDLYQEDPNLLALTGLGVFGMGLQTYKERSKNPFKSYNFNKN